MDLWTRIGDGSPIENGDIPARWDSLPEGIAPFLEGPLLKISYEWSLDSINKIYLDMLQS